MPFKAFWRTRIFTVTGLTPSLRFWSNFDPNFPPEYGQNQGPAFFQFSVLLFGFFSGTNGLMVKDQKITVSGSTTFSKFPLLRSSCCNFGPGSFQIHVIPFSIFFFYTSWSFFINFTLIFRCHNQRMERIDWIPRIKTLCWIFWGKNSLTKSNILEGCQTLIFSV